MKILIIGSNGFIGKAAVHYFLDKGFEVSGCDIVDNQVLSPSNFTLLNSLNPDFSIALRSERFNYCLNASGAASVAFSLTNPLEDYRLNVYNVFTILEAIRTHNPGCKFINLSSAAVYGNPQYLPVDELHPIQPLSPYGWHKFQSEQVCQEFFNIYNIQTCSLRIFSAFGPGLKKQLFWDMYHKIKKTKTVTLFGSGQESRDFIYISDLLCAIDIIFEHIRFCGQVINVANGDEITIKEAAAVFYKTFNEDVSFHFSGDVKVGDPVNWKADIALLKSIGYKRQVTFETGIKKYIRWLKENQ